MDAAARSLSSEAEVQARRVVLAVAGTLVLIAALAAATNSLLRPRHLTLDLNAFYCGGRTLARGADPYRAEPLGACERRPMPPPLPYVPAGASMPASLPPYALAPFMLLGRLPYGWVVALWSTLGVVATGFALFALQRLTQLNFAPLGAAFALGTLVGLGKGQVAPLAIAGVALAAYFCARQKPTLAALAASLATIEPHVGLPACLALFLWEPKTRLPLALAGLFCLAISLSFAGPAVCLEYVRAVLPAHALAEASAQQQFSLTYVLHRFGVPAVLAVHVGEAWYATLVALGVTFAGRLKGRLPALIPSLPVAFAVFGGPFIHAVQEPAALPAAFILFAATHNRWARLGLGICITLVALPFTESYGLGRYSGLLFGAVTMVLAATLAGARVWPSLALGALTSGVVFACCTLPGPTPSLAALAAAYDPHALADTSWKAYMELVSHADASPAGDFLKIPMWVGLAGIVLASQFQPGRLNVPFRTTRRGNAESVLVP